MESNPMWGVMCILCLPLNLIFLAQSLPYLTGELIKFLDEPILGHKPRQILVWNVLNWHFKVLAERHERNGRGFIHFPKSTSNLTQHLWSSSDTFLLIGLADLAWGMVLLRPT